MPKRQRGESSQPPTTEAFCAKQKALIEKKKFVDERWMQWEIVPELDKYRHTINSHVWGQFVSEPIVPHPKLVKEFCFAMAISTMEDKCVVRNKEVSFSAEPINEVYGTPNTPPSEDSYLLLQQDTEWQKMTDHVLTQRQDAYHPSGKSLLRDSCLSRKAKVWKKFIQNRVFPSRNDSDLTDEHQQFLFCVITHQPVNVGRVINDRLRVIAGDIYELTMQHRQRLGYPSLITTLCQRAGISLAGQRGTIGTVMDQAFWAQCLPAPGTSESIEAVTFWRQHWRNYGTLGFRPPPPMIPFGADPLLQEPQQMESEPTAPQTYPQYDLFFQDARWLAHQQSLLDMEHRQNQYNYSLMQHMFSRMTVGNQDPLPTPYAWSPVVSEPVQQSQDPEPGDDEDED